MDEGKALASDNNPVTPPSAQAPRSTYRQILVPAANEPVTGESTDMVAKRKGEFLSVKIDDALVKNGVSELAHSLVGKLSLASGDVPYSLDSLYMKLSQSWGIVGD